MKGNPKTYRSINELVDSSLLMNQESAVKREQVREFALKYFDEVHFKHGTDIKTVQLNLKPWKAIQLPDDCVDWVCFGIQCGEEIKTFVNAPYAPAMLFTNDSEGVPQANQTCDYSTCSLSDLPVDGSRVIPYFNVSPLGEDPGRLFGLMVKDNGLGYFSENKNKDVAEIQFKGDINLDTVIYVQYITSGINPSGETLVHPYFAQFIIAGVDVERIRRGGRTEAWRLDDAKEEFDRQFYLVLDYTWEWGVEDIVELLKSGYGMYPKK